MKKTHAAVAGKGSPLSRYQEVIVGSRSLWYFLYFELCLLLGVIPGVMGFFLRKLTWPRLFASCGSNVNFGSQIILRHPCRINLGENIIISEGCVLDGRSESNNAIDIGDNVILSNNVILSCKNGFISIGAHTGINTGSVIQSTNQCSVVIGSDVIIGQLSFAIGGGNYNSDRIDIPIRKQGIQNDGGVTVEDNVWLGANVSVLGGVTVGHGSIVGAGAVVTRSVAERSVCHGVPARVVKTRDEAS